MTDRSLFKSTAPHMMHDLMADFGLTAIEAAAIAGNAGHESGGFKFMQELKPVSGRGGLGFFQWTGPRRVRFESWCARKGYKVSSYEANYSFLFRELSGSEAGAIQKLKAAPADLRSKVVAFEAAFERAGVKHYDSRVQWAQIALDAFRAVAAAPEPSAAPPAVIGSDKPIPHGVLERAIAAAAEPQKDSTMDGFKGFFASKTVWANIVGFLAATPLGAKFLAGANVSQLVEAVSTVVVVLAPIVSTFFRLAATKQLVTSSK
jgi:hypothetical protein